MTGKEIVKLGDCFRHKTGCIHRVSRMGQFVGLVVIDGGHAAGAYVDSFDIRYIELKDDSVVFSRLTNYPENYVSKVNLDITARDVKEPKKKFLEPGMILEGTCKCDESKKDYFLVGGWNEYTPGQSGCTDSRLISIHAIGKTEDIFGWESVVGRGWNIDSLTFEDFNNHNWSWKRSAYADYNYRILEGLTLDTLKKIVGIND